MLYYIRIITLKKENITGEDGTAAFFFPAPTAISVLTITIVRPFLVHILPPQGVSKGADAP